ncbi:MAG: BMP family ABC transporter substrate-binding protein [Rhizobiaceae bacterium]|nr:BMP family ABC transporter substrate-binding protein [Rhizobiaceae bacterium]
MSSSRFRTTHSASRRCAASPKRPRSDRHGRLPGRGAEKAAEFPDTDFAIIDMVVDKPNVRSVVYKEQEVLLAGILAAMASETKKVGFVGGMDIPLIRKFACGYVGGAKAAGATEVFENMTGDTPAAWNDPTRGGEITKSQIDRGADVVYAVAGGTGIGVLQAGRPMPTSWRSASIPTRTTCSPATVLTSMLKRVDVAVYDAFMDPANGEFSSASTCSVSPRTASAMRSTSTTRPLITDEMKAAVEKAKADIIAGTVDVHDYMSDNGSSLH